MHKKKRNEHFFCVYQAAKWRRENITLSSAFVVDLLNFNFALTLFRLEIEGYEAMIAREADRLNLIDEPPSVSQ